MKKFTVIGTLLAMLALTLPASVSAKHVCILGAPLENCTHEKATCTDVTTNQKIGYRNSSVTKLQTYLAFYGYLGVSPTGYFGVKTQEAVISFQSAHGIDGTGFVGPITRAQIKTNSCTSGLLVTPVVNPTPTNTQPQTTQPISSAWTSWAATKLSPLSEAAMTALKQALGAVGVNTNFATTTLTEQEIIDMTKKFEQEYILNQ